jgi:hypothetical protein
MSKDSNTETDQRQFWQMAIEAWQASGLSVRQFCRQEGLSEPSFYGWRKQLTHPAVPEPDPGTHCPPSPFIQVSLPSLSGHGLELLLSSGHTLRIPSGVDKPTLTAVFSALGEAGLC